MMKTNNLRGGKFYLQIYAQFSLFIDLLEKCETRIHAECTCYSILVNPFLLLM